MHRNCFLHFIRFRFNVTPKQLSVAKNKNPLRRKNTAVFGRYPRNVFENIFSVNRVYTLHSLFKLCGNGVRIYCLGESERWFLGENLTCKKGRHTLLLYCVNVVKVMGKEWTCLHKARKWLWCHQGLHKFCFCVNWWRNFENLHLIWEKHFLHQFSSLKCPVGSSSFSGDRLKLLRRQLEQ